LYNELKNKYSNKVNFTYGYITNINRRKLELEKTHYNDCLAMHKKEVEDNINSIYIKQVRKKKRSLHEAIPRAGRSDKVNTTQKRSSKNTKEVIKNDKKWSLWDKVYISELGTTGFVSGFTGKWVYVQDINNNYLKLPNKSYKQMNRDNVRLVTRNNNWIRKEIA